jgi:hypothetical protein
VVINITETSYGYHSPCDFQGDTRCFVVRRTYLLCVHSIEINDHFVRHAFVFLCRKRLHIFFGDPLDIPCIRVVNLPIGRIYIFPAYAIIKFDVPVLIKQLE